jgi:hypothetical protein
MMTLAQELTASGKYTAVLVSVEGGSALEDDLDGAKLYGMCGITKSRQGVVTGSIRKPLLMGRLKPRFI